LQRNEIAFPRYDGSDVEYVFKHVSMRDLAYNTLVQKRRRQLHLEVARAIAALYPSDEYVEIIAYHYARTTEHAEAAVWLERAGDRAAAIYANEAAIGHFEEAQKRLEIVGPDPATAARLDEKQGAVLYAAGRYDEALAPLQRALHAYREMQRLEDAGRVAAQIGMAHRYQGTPDEGLAQIQPMLLRLAPSGRSEALAALAIALASNLFLLGRYQEAVDAAGQAADPARAIGNDRFLGAAE
jgi:predicted ATPase